MADNWDSSLYDDRHAFVWKTSADLIDLLANASSTSAAARGTSPRNWQRAVSKSQASTLRFR